MHVSLFICVFTPSKTNETLPIIKTQKPQKRRNTKNKMVDPCLKRQKNHLIMQTTKGNQIFKPLPITRSISIKEKGEPLKRMPSLEEPSLTTTTHFKIEIAYAHCNTIDTLCL
jgi:hypothetical protein